MTEKIFKIILVAGLVVLAVTRPVIFRPEAATVGQVAPGEASGPAVPIETTPPPAHQAAAPELTATPPRAVPSAAQTAASGSAETPPKAVPSAAHAAADAASNAAAATRMPGIDVSHFQGAVDWQAVAGHGIAFTYLKATEGLGYADPRHSRNHAQATEAGLRVGSYHFFIPHDDPVEQAKQFLKIAKVGTGSLPPVLDLERTPRKAVEAEVGKRAAQWLSHVETATGCKPVVYADRSYWDTYLASDVQGYALWLAEYSRRPRLPRGVSSWTFWQHTEHGQVNGISGGVDLNWFHAGSKVLDALLCR